MKPVTITLPFGKKPTAGEIKELIADYMMRAKERAAKYSDVDALLWLGVEYDYAHKVSEKTALHIIIKNLRNNPEAAPYLPKLPEIV